MPPAAREEKMTTPDRWSRTTPLLIGQRLGPYEIGSVLGFGGMEEVYRARDTRLGRDVALKILPEAFSGDADNRARFEREARLLAALNHPHIGAIYGFEDRDDMHALVLELVEGPTLAERLPAGPVPIPNAGTTRSRWGRADHHHSELGVRDRADAWEKIRKGVCRCVDSHP
jgi:serine/threonine protein kinase